MKKRIRATLMLGVVMIFLVSGCAISNIEKPAPAVGVPLVGLTWHGEPCTMILVPDSLPQKFIDNANDYIISRQSYGGGLVSLVFVFEEDLIISARAIRECPAFLGLDVYYTKTGKGRYWVYSPDGRFKEVDSDTSTEFLGGWMPEMLRSYCPEEKLDKVGFTKTGLEFLLPTVEEMQDWRTVETTIGPCGPWIVVVNPGEGRYRVGYLHLHPVPGGMLPVKYGLMDRDGNSKHLILGEDGWEDSPYLMPSAEEVMREHLPERGKDGTGLGDGTSV